MKISKTHFFFTFLSVLLSTTQANQNSAFFIFGDSLFDAGNNNYLKNATFVANIWPYGETYFKYPTGRFSDGRIIPDFIAGYKKLPVIPPYLQPGNYFYEFGVNFASAGAGVLVETLERRVVSLKTQLGCFKETQKKLRQKLSIEERNLLISKSVFLFSIGGNDYAFTKNTPAFHSFSPQQFVQIVISNFTDAIREIYKSGGRRFGIVNIGDYGCSPLMRAKNGSGGCFDEFTHLIQLHNVALFGTMKNLKRELRGLEYSLLDFYTLMSRRINHPSKYGFKEGKTACCGSGAYNGKLSCGSEEFKLCENPHDYLFFDGAHLTDKAYCQLSEILWSGNSDLVWPYNLKTLLS